MPRRIADDHRRERGWRQSRQTICAYPDAAPLGAPGASAVCWLATGEDVRVLQWPLVVTCDAAFTPQQISQMLRWLADRLEHGADADDQLLVKWP